MASIYLSFSSSICPSPIPKEKLKLHNNAIPNPKSKRPTFFCAIAPPDSKTASPAKKRHWKEGEYPGFSETSLVGNKRKNPVKNVKKKLDRKEKAKAWVNTVTEALSDSVDKKQWLRALEVICYFFCLFFSSILHFFFFWWLRIVFSILGAWKCNFFFLYCRV